MAMSAFVMFIGLVGTVVNLGDLRSPPFEAELPWTTGTVVHALDRSREIKNRGWVDISTLTIDTSDHRQRVVILTRCDDGTFPVAGLVGKAVDVGWYRGHAIGLKIDGRVCFDVKRRLKYLRAEHEAAPVHIFWGVVVMAIGAFVFWASFYLLFWHKSEP